MWDSVLALVGVVVGGIISLATNSFFERRRMIAQTHQRRRERADDAAQEIAKTLIELQVSWRSFSMGRMSGREQEQQRGEANRAIRIELLRLTHTGVRARFDEVLDLIGWDVVVSGYQRQVCLDHLIDCCGYIMRGEKIPELPAEIRELMADLESYLETQNEANREQSGSSRSRER